MPGTTSCAPGSRRCCWRSSAFPRRHDSTNKMEWACGRRHGGDRRCLFLRERIDTCYLHTCTSTSTSPDKDILWGRRGPSRPNRWVGESARSRPDRGDEWQASRFVSVHSVGPISMFRAACSHCPIATRSGIRERRGGGGNGPKFC